MPHLRDQQGPAPPKAAGEVLPCQTVAAPLARSSLTAFCHTISQGRLPSHSCLPVQGRLPSHDRLPLWHIRVSCLCTGTAVLTQIEGPPSSSMISMDSLDEVAPISDFP